MAQKANKPDESYSLNPTDEIFKGDYLEKAKEIEEKLEVFDKNENVGKMRKIKSKAKKIKEKSVKTKNIKKAKSVITKNIKKAKSVKSKALKKKKVK